MDELGGVLLSYSDLSLPSDRSVNPFSCGSIFQERSYIHFSVELKALSWRCAAGERYTGVVNAVAGDHVSVLLHGIFTATIPLSAVSTPKTWSWQADRERWVDSARFVGELPEESDDPAAAKEEGVKDEEASDDDEEAAAAAAAAPGKKLTKKELKKLERRKLRAVMLAATGRVGGGVGGPAAVKAPAAGVVVRGVHLRFECLAVQHTDEYLKLTGAIVLPKPAKGAPKAAAVAVDPSAEPLGLTGGFTALAPLEVLGGSGSGSGSQQANNQEAAPMEVEEPFLDMDAIAAVTAPMRAVAVAGQARNNTNAAASAAAATATGASATPAPAAASSAKKPLNAKQQEKFAKKKAKLAERMAAKDAAAGATTAAAPAAPAAEVTPATPAKKSSKTPAPIPDEPAAAAASGDKKKRKGTSEEEAAEGKKSEKKKKKLKTEG